MRHMLALSCVFFQKMRSQNFATPVDFQVLWKIFVCSVKVREGKHR